MATINTLEEKMKHGLGVIYDAEHQFLEAQEEMLSQANSQTVKSLLEEHIAQTEEQIGILEQVYEVIGEEPERIKCAGAAGIVSEGQKTLKEVSGNPALVDLAIAGGCAKVEHYEIASYRALITGAEQTGQTKVAQLLQQILQQEEQTVQHLESSEPMLLQAAKQQEAAA